MLKFIWEYFELWNQFGRILKKKLVCFFRGQKTPNKQTNKQKGGGVFSNCVQGNLTEILKYDFILFEKKCYIIDSKMHFFLCEYFNKHVYKTFGFATLYG